MTSSPPSYKAKFLQTCLSTTPPVLQFGTFTLKSGRLSPYFFNASQLIQRADLLSSLASAYARCIAARAQQEQGLKFDVLFGPAYKGIPIAVATALKLAELDDCEGSNGWKEVGVAFNRKEAKDHGEGGCIVGASLRGKRVVIIDDVITAGTAAREAIDIIKREGGEVVGLVVVFDRQERVNEADDKSAVERVEADAGIDVLKVLTLHDLEQEVKRGLAGEDELNRLTQYRQRYGISNLSR